MGANLKPLLFKGFSFTGSKWFRISIHFDVYTGQRLLQGKALSIGEVQALFHVCAQDKSVKGSRDAALIAVLYAAGLRRSEVVAIDLSDWDIVDNCLTVRSGKEDKDRTTYLDDGGNGGTNRLAGLAGGCSRGAVLSNAQGG